MISLVGKDITAGYGGVDIIKNVNLYVNEGEIVVIVGPNGAGKSTVMKSILGMLNLSSGSVDFSGKVIESDTLNFKPGDEVVLTGCRVGEIYPGGYSQLVKVKNELLVKKPKSISNKNAMILGTAGFTSLLCAFAIKAREELLLGEKVNDVLVTGATGGVGSIAIMVLSKFGYKVSAVTGKKDKSNYLKELGASNIIDRKDFEGEPRVLGKGLWDGVVDTVGGKILANAISHTKPNGIVASCGLAADYKLHTTVMPFIIRGVKLWGIDSVMISKKRREFIWSQVAELIDFKFLEKYIKTISLEDLLNIFPQILKGEKEIKNITPLKIVNFG